MIELDSMPTMDSQEFQLRPFPRRITCGNREQGEMPRWGGEKAHWVPSGVFERCQKLHGRGNRQSGNFLLLQRCCGTMWHHMAPCNLCMWNLWLFADITNAHHHRTAFSSYFLIANIWKCFFQICLSKHVFFHCDLSSQFLVFKIPNPTLATRYSKIRQSDPLHSEFLVSFQGVAPCGCPFCTFFAESRCKADLLSNHVPPFPCWSLVMKRKWPRASSQEANRTKALAVPGKGPGFMPWGPKWIQNLASTCAKQIHDLWLPTC